MTRLVVRMRAAGLLAAAVLMSGCWLQVGQGPAHQWSNLHEKSLTEDYVTTLSQTWFANLGATKISAPVVSGGRVYVTYLVGTSPQQARVAALDADDGTVVWSHDLGVQVPNAVLGTAVFVDGELSAQWFGADPVSHACTGGVERIDPDTGAVLATELPNGQSSAAVAFGDSVASTRSTFDTANCLLVDGPWLTVQVAATGAVEWKATTGVDNADLPYVIGNKLVVGGTTAYAAGGCGTPTCAPLWSASVPDGIQTFGVSNAGVFGATGAKRLVALDLDDGTQTWQATLPGFGEAIAIAGNRVYVVTSPDPAGQRLLVFAAGGCGAATCSPLWSVVLGANAGQPVVAGGAVYVPTGTTATGFNDVVVFDDADDCVSSACGYHSIATPVSELVVADGRLFGVSGGGLRAFTPDLSAQDSVTGSGTIQLGVGGQPGPVTPFEFDAHSGPNGENATGEVSLTTLFADAPVLCLDVRTIHGTTPFLEATMNLDTSNYGLVTLQVSDGDPEGLPDFISARTFSERSPTDCSRLNFGDETLQGVVKTGNPDLVNINPV